MKTPIDKTLGKDDSGGMEHNTKYWTLAECRALAGEPARNRGEVFLRVDGEQSILTPAKAGKVLASIYSTRPKCFVNAAGSLTIDFDR